MASYKPINDRVAGIFILENYTKVLKFDPCYDLAWLQAKGLKYLDKVFSCKLQGVLKRFCFVRVLMGYPGRYGPSIKLKWTRWMDSSGVVFSYGFRVF